MADFLSHTEKKLNWNTKWENAPSVPNNTNNTASLPKVDMPKDNNHSAAASHSNKASLPKVNTNITNNFNAAKKGTGKTA